MKKIVLTVVAMMAIATTTFAKNDSNVAENTVNTQYTINFNNDRLATYLQLNETQKEEMKSVHNQFAHNMSKAINSKIEKRQKFTTRAVYQNLGCMRSILNEEQFAKYRTLLFVTLKNRGINF